MSKEHFTMPLKLGLLLVALSWFLFSLYEFAKAAFNIGHNMFWIELTDTAGVIGLGFRTAAGFIAVITILFYLFRHDLSRPEALMSLRWIILLEAVNFAVLFPSGIWGTISFDTFYGIGFFIETGLPCLIESILIPIVLAKLFLELNPNKPTTGAIKWALTAGTVYIFVFWLNNTCNWVFAIMQKGLDYMLAYPANILSFIVTSVGLLALGVYAAYFTRKNSHLPSISKLNLQTVGAIVTLMGTYFLGLYIMWAYLGTVGGWSDWYAWFLGHNVDLWAMALPLIGLPLMLHDKTNNNT
ncbi:MAG: hypothetical protein NWF04_07360 [Candidatus Bathyarchaeota archaeon]|nr:hypothetical protein [Candidatus Bathyarchaeota archaeon]